jgi:uncharacterized protein
LIALPDINVLLALAWSNHPHHDAAHDWFGREATSGWATCLLTQSGFLRLSMNPQIVGAAIDCSTACDLLGQLVAHSQHRYEEIAPALEGQEFADICSRIRGYRQVSDATLAFRARVQGLKLVTFDQAAESVCPWKENFLLLSTTRA